MIRLPLRAVASCRAIEHEFEIKGSGARKRDQAVGNCLIGLVTIGPR